jgi:3-hydroxy-5-methyl-1-naphthoate 3-O-methyltransferase
MVLTAKTKICFLLAIMGCRAFTPRYIHPKSKNDRIILSSSFDGSYSEKDAETNDVAVPDDRTLAKPLTTTALGRREALAASAMILSGPFALDKFLPTLQNTITSTPQVLANLDSSDSLVRNLWLGRLTYPTLVVAVEAGLFEALKSGGLTKRDLGKHLDPAIPGDGRAMEALTSVLVALGLLQFNQDHLELTASARTVLLKDSPYFWGPQLLAADGSTASLRRALKHESVRETTMSETTFQAHSSSMIGSFTSSMQAHSGVTAELAAIALHEMLGPNPTLHVLDMAGGSGCFARALVQHCTHIRVTLADLPPVVDLWRRENASNKRIDARPADLFDVATWPRGPNVVLLANVLHDWGHDQVKDIVGNARTFLQASSGRLIIVEQLLADDKSGPLPAALASVSMLLGDWRTGKQYSFDEMRDLLLKTGFHRVQLGPRCGSFHRAVIAYVDPF